MGCIEIIDFVSVCIVYFVYLACIEYKICIFLMFVYINVSAAVMKCVITRATHRNAVASNVGKSYFRTFFLLND